MHVQIEESKPGYYSVNLKDYDIQVELTATARAGFHRYTFNKAKTGGKMEFEMGSSENKNLYN